MTSKWSNRKSNIRAIKKLDFSGHVVLVWILYIFIKTHGFPSNTAYMQLFRKKKKRKNSSNKNNNNNITDGAET